MNSMKLKDLLYFIGGSTKIVIFNVAGNNYEELWRGIMEDISHTNLMFMESKVEHITVVNGEDYLQIHIIL